MSMSVSEAVMSAWNEFAMMAKEATVIVLAILANVLHTLFLGYLDYCAVLQQVIEESIGIDTFFTLIPIIFLVTILLATRCG
ncbi:hypothetical protein ABEF95_003094 [Exophiala dermatitidis]